MNDVIERAKKIEQVKRALESIKARGSMEKCAFSGGEKARYDSCVYMMELADAALTTLSELLTLVPEDKEEWQPIEIEPEYEAGHSIPLLVYSEYTGICMGQFTPCYKDAGWDSDMIWTIDSFSKGISPTHWKPKTIPTLPKQEQSKPNKE